MVLQKKAELARAREARILAELAEAEYDENHNRQSETSEIDALQKRLQRAGLGSQQNHGNVSGITHVPAKQEQADDLPRVPARTGYIMGQQKRFSGLYFLLGFDSILWCCFPWGLLIGFRSAVFHACHCR